MIVMVVVLILTLLSPTLAYCARRIPSKIIANLEEARPHVRD
jgi:hypothetical protein